MSGINKLFLSFFGTGFVPVLPGTAGSIAAFFVFLGLAKILPESLFLKTMIIVLLFITIFFLSIVIIKKEIPAKDPDKQWIVIDEVLGMLIAMLPYFYFDSFSLPYALASLLFFRVFDMGKPFGIKAIDRIKKPSAVLLDDVVAGIYALAVSLIIFFGSRYV